jgi:hypothetical protein
MKSIGGRWPVLTPDKADAGPTTPPTGSRPDWETVAMQATMPLSTMKTLPGAPYPLAAVYDGSGTNFAVFSEVAERIDLCLFDEDGRETRITMNERDGYNWHTYLTS